MSSCAQMKNWLVDNTDGAVNVIGKRQSRLLRALWSPAAEQSCLT